jgi:arylsulfatase A-like enzyme
MGKQNQYDHSIRVPLLMAGPGIPAGRKRDTYAYLLDVYPTLCELLDLPTPGSVEGQSLVPALQDEGVRIRETIFAGFREFQRSVKDNRYKLIEYAAGGSRNTQLFDLHEDPEELRDLSAAPEHAGRVADLRALLEQYRDDWDDRDTEWGRIFWDQYEAGA